MAKSKMIKENPLGIWYDLFEPDEAFYLDIKSKMSVAFLARIRKDIGADKFKYSDVAKIYGKDRISRDFYKSIRKGKLNAITTDQLIINAQRIGMTKEELFKYI